MAALPLALDTLQSPSIEEPATAQFPVMSPQLLKADTSNNTLVTTTPERPSNLTLDSSQQQQQHSNNTPTHGTISPALSSAGSLSPSFLPEMPQWKRDLIQRRKQNVQRTISASSPTATAAVSSPLAASPTTSSIYGLKTSTSSSSVRSLAGSNTNIDQVASDGLHTSTKDYNKTSSSAYSASSSSSLSTAATTKVNKQHATTTTTTTTTAMPATIIKSPIQEKAEKLFGGQYTATSSSSSLSLSLPSSASISATVTTLTITKEEKKITTITQQELMEGLLENEEAEHWEKSKKTKEYMIDTEEEDENENDETQISTVTTTTSNKQQMATRLTGSTHNNVVGQREDMLKERELILNNIQHNNITGANVILKNQSLNKCESERLVCAANISSCSSTAVTNNINNNTSCSVTSGINSSNSSSVVKISQKLQDNQFIKNEQQQHQQINTKKFIKFKTNSYSQDLKSPTKATSSSASALATNCAIKKKMVAVQEMKKSTQNTATHLHPMPTTCNNSQQANIRANNRSAGGVANSSASNATDLDNNEDLSYGPGIVSKLRCRYLSLALRESMEQQRLNKDQLRRSTSLNNLLDNNEDDDENCDDEDEDDEDEENIEVEGDLHDNKKNNENSVCKKTGILKNSCNNQDKRFSQGSNGVGVTFTETSFNKRSRHLKRGNDSLKRARSVEALLSEKSPWQSRTINTTPTCVTIEDKIHNARERLHQGTEHMPPKRLTSIIDDTERPPPDLVKQTLKMFEASANRRPRLTNRSNSKGDVASKVETFKNIIKDQKPVVSYPKPASPTKKLNTTPLQKPVKTSTPQASDLLQSPLGRKTLATANSNSVNDGLTPLKTNNTLSDNTPDIIPRQKVLNERDFKQTKEKFTTNQINKEKFLNSIRDTPLSNVEIMDSPLNVLKREQKEKFEVDSPLTALTKELSKLKLSDNNTPTRKIDNFSSDTYEISNGGGGSAGGDSVSGDACLSHKNPHNNEENKELNSSLKNENDKQKQINNETIEETTNEATVNYNDCSATKASPPPSSSDLSDGEEDDEYGGLKTKRITRTALDNIAKAGYTQQFKFNSSASNTPNNTHSTSSPLNSVKQIGVIRPLLNTNQQQQQKISSDMDTLKHSTFSSLTSREIEKNRINDLKKSSSTQPSSATSSPNTSLDNVIKSTSSSSASSNTEVDTVISATNSPLWAMRKRRQAPPAAPAENTTMVFNFSNRKEVPDYIENDGVIFRRKRELPKPNESGFVLLGDLSVETSTDFDCDDFSMCPPSPCDVEFENANIVIDGKSSIRQKPKDASFRVQFNDTLTSTFEYPSEASLIVDDSFSAYNHGYTQPHGSSGDDFTHAFQNLVLENFTSSADQMSHQFPLHHVADEIIQLPTNQASSPANTTTEVTTPTKNILGNLPLDYPDLEKGIQLTIPTTVTSAPIKTQDNESKRSRKDLKLPLENHQLLQKPPPLPMKRFQMMPLQANRQNSEGLLTNSKDLQLQKKIALNASKHKEEFQNGKTFWDIKKDCRDDNSTSIAFKQRKTPRVLNNPQYACFLQQHESPTKYPVQRSRSNEFRKSFGSLNMSTPVLRSNSLRNLEKFHTSNALTSTSFTTTTSLYFSAEVNSTIENLLSPKVKPAKNPAKEYRTLKSVSLHNIPQSSESFENFSNSCHELTECLDNMPNNLMKSPQICTLDSFRQTLSPSKSLTALTIEDNACCKTENFLNFKTESLDNLNSSNNLTFNMLTSLTNEGDNIVSPKDFHYSTEYSVNMEENFLNSKSNSIDNISSTEMAENFMNSKTKSLNNLAPTKSSHNLPDCSGNVRKTVSKSQSTSVGSLTATVRSTVNDLTEYFALQSITKSIDTIKTNDTFNSLTEQSVKKNDYLLKPKTISIDNANFNVSSNESAEYSSGLTNNLVNFKSQKLTQGPSIASLINLNKTLQMSIDSLDDYQDAVDGNQECFETPTNSVKTDCNLINLPNNNSLNLAESCVNNKVESITDLHLIESNETLKETSKVSQPLQPLRDSEALDILEEIDVGSHKESQAKCKDKLKDSEALAILEIIAIGPHNQLSLPASKKQLNDSKSLEILEDIAVGLDTPSLFDFTELIGADKGKSYTDGIGNKSTNDISAEKVVRLEDSCKTQENPNNIISKISENAQFKPIDPAGLSTTVPIKTTQKLFNFANLSCENISTYSAFRKSQNFRTHTSDSFRNSLKFYETLNEKTPELSDEFSNNSVSIKRSVSFTDSLSNKDEINGNFLVNSSRTEDIKETKQINNPDAPKENSFSLDNYDTFGNLNGNLVNHSSLKENVAKATDTDCVINNKNLLKQKNQDIDLKLDINSNLASGKANELKEEGLNITKDCSGIHSKLPKNLCDFLTNKSLDSPHFLADFGLPENRVENIKTCLTKQLDTLLRPINLKETPVDFNINTSSNTELHSAVKEADSNLNINENSFEINANLTTNNFSHLNLSLQPNNDYNINTSPLPFRRKYEAITVVVSPENCPLSDPLCDLNSAQSLALTSPRPFKGLAKTVDSFTKANTASDCPVNFKNTQRLTNCFGTLTNNFDYLTKSVDSALNVDSLGKSSSFIFTKKETQAALVNSTEIFNLNLTKIPVDTTKTLVRKPLTTNGTLQTLGNSKTASIKSKTFDISTTTTADPCSSKVDLSLVTESATKFSTHSPTLAPKTFSNTKHLKLAVHDNSSISSTSWQTVKDPSTTTTTTNKSSLKNYTNFETKVEVSKPNTYSTTISQTPSSFSSTHLCRTSSEANSTVKTQQLTRKATTIASNSTNPPKVLPRRIFTAAPTNLVATMTCSSTSYTATTATSPVSSSSSSTSSCYNASISTTTSNSTPLRRRIPGNTLYYV